MAHTVDDYEVFKQSRNELLNKHPLVVLLYNILDDKRMTATTLAKKAGVSRELISRWRNISMPKIVDLEACFNVLGYDIIVVRRDSDIPK